MSDCEFNELHRCQKHNDAEANLCWVEVEKLEKKIKELQDTVAKLKKDAEESRKGWEARDERWQASVKAYKELWDEKQAQLEKLKQEKGESSEPPKEEHQDRPVGS